MISHLKDLQTDIQVTNGSLVGLCYLGREVLFGLRSLSMQLLLVVFCLSAILYTRNSTNFI